MTLTGVRTNMYVQHEKLTEKKEELRAQIDRQLNWMGVLLFSGKQRRNFCPEYVDRDWLAVAVCCSWMVPIGFLTYRPVAYVCIQGGLKLCQLFIKEIKIFPPAATVTEVN